MTSKTQAPYGSWTSPVGAKRVATSGVGLSDLQWDSGKLYWLENRPDEGGRGVIVESTTSGETRDITPKGYNVRSTVHEYGGGAYKVVDGTLYFSNYQDQRLYRQPVGANPMPMTSDATDIRFSDACLDLERNRLLCIREDHRGSGEATNALVAIDLEAGGEGNILIEGSDFISSARLSPDGKKLAWITWDHPNMPWDVTDLHLADVTPSGQIEKAICLKQPMEGAISQPRWSPDGELYFIADWTDWWNLYRWRNAQGVQIHKKDADFAGPNWVFGLSSYTFLSEKEATVSFTQNGSWSLANLNLTSGTLRPIEATWSSLRSMVSANGTAFFLGEKPSALTGVFQLQGLNIGPIKAPNEVDMTEEDISIPKAISFPTAKNEVSYGFYYPPANAKFDGPKDELPPLLVKVHGGPTSATTSAFSSKIQFWTTRGFAVLDLNHRGSTGFGRAFRQKLMDAWGIVDVEDATYGARYLADKGEVDGKKLAITGGSAGGFTVLSALAFHDVFTAGASHFGVSDLEGLAKDTHKFESRYLHGLIGPYPGAIDIYKKRSPINGVNRITAPLIILQGLEDRVVPPSQSETVFGALKANNIPVAYLPFEGEQHGFRQAHNIERALEAELYFYGRAFGFVPDGSIEPFQIDNEDRFQTP
jgi:dipeptidyl aminopeptidase/acylaminoacyl peptidase